MMWVIGILTGILILDCLVLVLLVLVQLPKKEAGLGQAFGGSATDALFGAGSGNALTKMTKYATVVFLVLTLGLSILNAQNKTRKSKLEENLQKLSKTVETPAPAVPGTVSTNLIPTAVPAASNASATNVEAPAPAAATNTAPPAADKPQ